MHSSLEIMIQTSFKTAVELLMRLNCQAFSYRVPSEKDCHSSLRYHMIPSRRLELAKFDRNIIIDPVISMLHCANSRISVSAEVLDRMMFDQSRFDIQFCPPFNRLPVNPAHHGHTACVDPSTGFGLLLRSEQSLKTCIIDVQMARFMMVATSLARV